MKDCKKIQQQTNKKKKIKRRFSVDWRNHRNQWKAVRIGYKNKKKSK